MSVREDAVAAYQKQEADRTARLRVEQDEKSQRLLATDGQATTWLTKRFPKAMIRLVDSGWHDPRKEEPDGWPKDHKQKGATYVANFRLDDLQVRVIGRHIRQGWGDDTAVWEFRGWYRGHAFHNLVTLGRLLAEEPKVSMGQF